MVSFYKIHQIHGKAFKVEATCQGRREAISSAKKTGRLSLDTSQDEVYGIRGKFAK